MHAVCGERVSAITFRFHLDETGGLFAGITNKSCSILLAKSESNEMIGQLYITHYHFGVFFLFFFRWQFVNCLAMRSECSCVGGNKVTPNFVYKYHSHSTQTACFWATAIVSKSKSVHHEFRSPTRNQLWFVNWYSIRESTKWNFRHFPVISILAEYG